MARKIALLRGINVGGKRKILMADLRALCESLGWKDVESYIQSGNLVFASDKTSNVLEEELHLAIEEQYGYEVPVIVRTSEELENTVANNPFLSEKPIEHLFLTFLQDKPSTKNIEKTLSYNYAPDLFHIHDKEVYLYCEGKYHKSKLTNSFFENKLKVKASTRNWKTVLTLLEKSKM